MAAVLEVVLKCRDDASVTLKQINQQVDSQKKNWEKSYGELAKVAQKAAIAITAIGAASLKFVGSARDMNAQLGMTGITIGATTGQMRSLAISTADAGFQLSEVIPTFDLLARAGVRSLETLKAVSKSFDDLGHAVGESAEQVAGEIIPTFDTFGININDAGQYVDRFTYLIKNTTLTLSDFQLTMRMLAPAINATGTTMDELIPILVAMEDKGIRGRRANALLTDALTQLDETGKPLIETLNLDADAVARIAKEMGNSTGITAQYAKQAETHLSIYEKMRAKFQELELQLGSFLTPLEPVLVGITALGPVMLILSNRTAVATGMWIAHKAAMAASTVATQAATAAQWALNVAMDANPIGLVIVALVALAAAIGVIIWKWDELTSFFSGKTRERVYVQAQALSEMTDDELRHIRDTEEFWRASFAKMILAWRKFYEDKQDVANKAWDADLADIDKYYGNLAQMEQDAKVSKVVFEQNATATEIDRLRKKYGMLEQEDTKGNRNLMQIAKDASQERLDIINQEMADIKAAYVKGISDRTAAIVRGYQDEIDALDDQTSAEEKILKKKDQQKRLTELRYAIPRSTSYEDYMSAVQDVADYEAQIAREQVLDSRDAEKEKLRDKIDAATTAGEEERAQFAETGIAANTTEGVIYNAHAKRLEDEKAGLDAALSEELNRIEVERIAAEKGSKDALVVKLDNIEKERIAAIAASDSQRDNAIANIQALSDAAQKAVDEGARQSTWENYGTASSGAMVAEKYGLQEINQNMSDQDVINYIKELRATSMPISEQELGLLALAYFGNKMPGSAETRAGLEGAIHGYQHGGVVPGPLGSPQLAIVHGGEEYAGVGGRVGGRTVNVVLNCAAFMGDQMQARAFASQIRRYIREDERLGGT